MDFFNTEFYGNELRAWIFALAIAIVGSIVLCSIKAFFIHRFKRNFDKSNKEIYSLLSNLLERTNTFFLVCFSVYFGLLILTFSDIARSWINKIAITFLLVQFAIWGNLLISLLLTKVIKKKVKEDTSAATTLMIINFISRLSLFSLVLILILDNLGLEITTLIAGLGIGGIAVALAAQNVLGDLFSSLSIAFDKPFEIGDFIIVDEFLGSVEHIGIKTTRIRSLSGEQLIFSNSDLIKSRIRNFKRMDDRRVVFNLGVTFQTPYKKLRQIPEMIQNIIENQPQTRFDRAHFKSFGDFALIFEIVYYITTPDYNAYMDIQQNINLEIYKEFEKKGIDFAYPTQTLYLNKESK